MKIGSATFNRLSIFISVILLFPCLMYVEAGPIAEGSVKFLGNIAQGTPASNYADYWNQVTLENGGKWGRVQPSQSSFDWKATDSAYEYCRTNGFPYKHHCFVWGSQYPNWITGLSAADQKAAVENWIKTYGERFPETEFIDVVNEPLTTACPFKEALGGDGTSGWDWVITSFELARQYCPNAKLLINEYNIVNSISYAVGYLGIVKLLQAKNLIDGIGIQSHCFNVQGTPVANIKKSLDTLASSGLPLYPSEFDITGDQTAQLNDYKMYFPIFWEHPAVEGVTLWGWTNNWKGGIIMSGTTEYLALKWLRTYVDSLEQTKLKRTEVPKDKGADISVVTDRAGRGSISLNTLNAGAVLLRIVDVRGRTIFSQDERFSGKGNHLISFPASSLGKGIYAVRITGERFSIGRKMVID